MTPFNSDIDFNKKMKSTTHSLGAEDHVLLTELISSFKPQSIEATISINSKLRL